ncbi:carboxypeptidase-like regulatory domain-containing protein [uncultured Algibacter sp.]|uniref:carboxypeptidase-like regulatory domain-containing protein n=1 Tax=uncultured Algibacter sp. TaxID=298659 RepID=UPI00262DC94A|nr:carboxypeptidase-like regulatory domain-containing protein [uncultured Algibacter sp.]
MTPKSLVVLAFLFLGFKGISQTFNGVVLDALTNKPLETATVYFDNTSIGVITNANGQFSIQYSNALQSPLIISYLGYEKQIIEDYRNVNNVTILLKEAKQTLKEVVINANDGLTRKQKLRLFRKEFLGFSRFGNSCKILNEDDIIIRYYKKAKKLTAYAKGPIRIQNLALQYLVEYDLTFFEIYFDKDIYDTKSVRFVGNSFFKNLKSDIEKKTLKNREKAYSGSRLEFMRALYSEELEDKKYEIFLKNLKVNPWNFFIMDYKNNSKIKKVSLNQPVDIIYNKIEQSTIEFLTPNILIDVYGNFNNVTKIRFTGVMGSQRIGELLPFDYAF